MRVAIWNIQNFGGANQELRRGVNGQLLANVIRDFVEAVGVDVLVIMEVLETAGPLLTATLDTLNAGIGPGPRWDYDWIRGAIGENRPNPPQAAGDLVWDSGPTSPRAEGYAMFWKPDPAKFSMVPALNPMSQGSPTGSHYLELVTTGLRFVPVPGNTYVSTGYDPAVDDTRPFDGAGSLAAWTKLNFPWVSAKDAPQPREYVSRRPVFAVLELVGAAHASERYCPLIVYHAPSNRTLSQWGTYLTSLSQQINVVQVAVGGALVRCDRAIVGGDFNTTPRVAGGDVDYDKYTNPYSRDIYTGGSDLAFLNAGAPVRSTVQINYPRTVTPIDGLVDADFVWMAIDQLMHRGVLKNVGESGVYPFLARLQEDPSPFARSLAAYRQHFEEQIAANRPRRPNPVTGPVDANMNPVFGTSKFTDWRDFMIELRVGARFDTARTAAEFFNIFVSDHLPLGLTFVV